MRNYIFIFIFMAGYPNSVLSQSTDLPDVTERVLLRTSEHCLLLSEHIPDDDVAYKPGVSAHGETVAPADLPGGNSLGLGEQDYSFLMTHDALNTQKSNENSVVSPNGLTPAQEGKIILGQVSVRDGAVFWNGQPLTSQDTAQIHILCNDDKRRNNNKR